jgi:hypothetical protein
MMQCAERAMMKPRSETGSFRAEKAVYVVGNITDGISRSAEVKHFCPGLLH